MFGDVLVTFFGVVFVFGHVFWTFCEIFVGDIVFVVSSWA